MQKYSKQLQELLKRLKKGKIDKLYEGFFSNINFNKLHNVDYLEKIVEFIMNNNILLHTTYLKYSFNKLIKYIDHLFLEEYLCLLQIVNFSNLLIDIFNKCQTNKYSNKIYNKLMELLDIFLFIFDIYTDF